MPLYNDKLRLFRKGTRVLSIILWHKSHQSCYHLVDIWYATSMSVISTGTEQPHSARHASRAWTVQAKIERTKFGSSTTTFVNILGMLRSKVCCKIHPLPHGELKKADHSSFRELSASRSHKIDCRFSSHAIPRNGRDPELSPLLEGRSTTETGVTITRQYPPHHYLTRVFVVYVVAASMPGRSPELIIRLLFAEDAVLWETQ